MYNSTKQLLLASVFLLLTSALFSQSYRYTKTVFPSSIKEADIIYGTAPFLNFPYNNESSTSIGDLVMDIYTPYSIQGDDNMTRPAIIFIHSGGFAIGNRNHDDMVAICDSFARKGYVTATIDYRKGFNAFTNAAMHGTRAVYRGLQDGRTAVRFLRANAATYGIDPNKVYLAGSSAGALITLHSIYMDEPSEKPANAGAVSYFSFPFSYTGPDLGAYDEGDNLSFNGKPDVILSLWGALQDTDLITASNNEPAFLVHGSADATVPFNTGPPFGLSTFPDVDGSNLINNELESLGLTNKEIYFVTGEGHEFHGTSNGTWTNGNGGNVYWDTIVQKSADFFWLQHKPTADFAYSGDGYIVDFLDNSSGALSWQWDFGDGNTSTLQNPSHTYAAYDDYQAFLYIENDIFSWDTISYQIEVTAPLPVAWLSPVRAFYENDRTTVTWSVSQQVNNEKFIIEHSLDARQFSAISEIKGAGDFNDVKAYTHFHNNPPTGLNYYRVVQLDFNGEMEYSNVASVKVENQKSSISIYPNPSSGLVTVNFLSGKPEAISVYNVLGELVKHYPNPEVIALLALPELESGMYFITVGNAADFQKLMVKRD